MKALLNVLRLAHVLLTVALVANAPVIVAKMIAAEPSKFCHLYCHILRPTPSMVSALEYDIIY